MRGCDLNSCTAKLDEAFDVLRKKRAWISAEWTDQTHKAFEQQYLDPLEVRVRRALDAMHQLNDLLRKAERECGDE